MSIPKTFLLIRPPKNSRKYPSIFHLLLLITSNLFCCLSFCRAATESLSKFPKSYPSPPLPLIPSSASESLELASISTSPSAPATAAASNLSYQNAGVRTILRLYDECGNSEAGFVPCLKKKAISFIDRISYIDAITVADGIRLVRVPASESADIAPVGSPPRPNSDENELDYSAMSPSSPRSIEDRDQRLTNMLIDRLSRFFNGHSLQISFPKMSAEEIGRGLEEGRGKMKKMMGMMVMGMAMKMLGMVPIAMGGLYMLAGKALIISKIALLLAGIMGLKKLMSGRGGNGGSGGWSSGGGGGGGGWSSGGGGGGGGWDRRSMNEGLNLAYRGYARQQKQVSAPNEKPRQQQEAQEQEQQKYEPVEENHHQHYHQRQKPQQQQQQQQGQEEEKADQRHEKQEGQEKTKQHSNKTHINQEQQYTEEQRKQRQQRMKEEQAHEIIVQGL